MSTSTTAPGDSRYSSWSAHRSKNVPATSRVAASVSPSPPRNENPDHTLDALGIDIGASRKRRTAMTSAEGTEDTPANPGAAASSGDPERIARVAPTPAAITTTSASVVSVEPEDDSSDATRTRARGFRLESESSTESSGRTPGVMDETRLPPRIEPPAFRMALVHG